MKQRHFICPVNEAPCESGDCLATRCMWEVEKREAESRARWLAKQERLRSLEPGEMTLADLLDDE